MFFWKLFLISDFVSSVASAARRKAARHPQLVRSAGHLRWVKGFWVDGRVAQNSEIIIWRRGRGALAFSASSYWPSSTPKFLCLDAFAGGADEDELFRTHSKFCDHAEVLHGVAAREAHESAPAVGYRLRAFDGGD